ncbi:MAG TPA: hypothetical protein VHN59_11055 [Chitinophagaceae bacterium]|nr:hypothetical protein [Chitinophagaceae bacterium]
MNQSKWAPLRPMMLAFVMLSAFFVIGKNLLAEKGIDSQVLIAGNLLLFGVSFLSFVLTQRSFQAKNPHVFVRAIYSSFIIKFFVLAAAAFIYIMVTGKNVNKPALFGCMGLYILYTVFEVSSLRRSLKQKANG